MRAVPYVPTTPKIVRRMLKIARVGPGDVVYDLGCGEGHILIMAVKEFGADRAVGYEMWEELCGTALSEITRLGIQGRVKIVNGDLFDADLYDATVITVYLDESTNQRLKLKLEREARVGTRIVSHVYEIKGWKVVKKTRLPHRTIFIFDTNLYLYTVPESITFSKQQKGDVELSGISDYMIHQFLVKNNGKATRREILDALGKDEETRRIVEEKLSMMQRFGLVTIDGDLVALEKR